MAPVPTEPVHLIEDAATGDKFLIYGTEKGLRVELRYEGETFWMSQVRLPSSFKSTGRWSPSIWRIFTKTANSIQAELVQKLHRFEQKERAPSIAPSNTTIWMPS